MKKYYRKNKSKKWNIFSKFVDLVKVTIKGIGDFISSLWNFINAILE